MHNSIKRNSEQQLIDFKLLPTVLHISRPLSKISNWTHSQNVKMQMIEKERKKNIEI